jgi:transcriptional regulator with XRE-family HTH domain
MDHGLKDWLDRKITYYLSKPEEKWEHLSYPSFDSEWLCKQPGSHSGLLLRDLVARSGKTQDELAEQTGTIQGSISDWEGGTPINRFKLGQLILALGLGLKESSDRDIIKRLVLLVRPNIEDNVPYPNWLERRIGFYLFDPKKNWVHLSFPSFHEDWLEVQEPPKMRGGLLLRDLMEWKGLTSREIEKPVGVSASGIRQWTQGGTIPASKLGQIITALGLKLPDKDKVRQFIKTIRPDIEDHVPAQWLEDRMGEYFSAERKWTYLSYPSLHEEWLCAQPFKYRAGLLLGDLMEIANIPGARIARELHVVDDTVSQWKRSTRINPEMRGQLLDILSCALPPEYAVHIERLRALAVAQTMQGGPGRKME